jgi:hypothetical protein
MAGNALCEDFISNLVLNLPNPLFELQDSGHHKNRDDYRLQS